MTLSLNPERTSDDSATLQLRMPQAIVPQEPVVTQEPIAEPQLPPVVLCVPDVGASSPVKSTQRTKMDGNDSVEAADAREGESLSAAPSMRSQLAQAWQSLDWAKVGQWAIRPVVTYSVAAVVMVIIIVAIATRSPAPVAPETSQGSVIAGDDSTARPHEHHLSEHPAKPDSHIEKQQPDQTAPVGELHHNPRDEVVKLPPVTEKNNAVLPWRQGTGTDFSPRQDLSKTRPAPRSAAERSETVRRPQAGTTQRSSGRPNVARLEGRIHTPKIPR